MDGRTRALIAHATVKDYKTTSAEFLERHTQTTGASESPQACSAHSGGQRSQKVRLQRDYPPDVIDYWHRTLAGAPRQIALPLDAPRTLATKTSVASVPVSVTSHVAQSAQELAQRLNAKLTDVLLAAWGILLARWSLQEDVCTGFSDSNTQMLPVRLLCTDNPNAERTVEHIKAQTAYIAQRPQIHLEDLTQFLDSRPETGCQSIFSVAFEFAHEGEQATSIDAPSSSFLLDLLLSVRQSPSGLTGEIRYPSKLFQQSTVARLCCQWQALLLSMAANPQCAVSRLTILSEEDRRLISLSQRKPTSFATNRPLHQLFEHVSDQHAEKIALVADEGALSYAELNRRANRVAHALLGAGVKPGDLVGLYVERGLDMIVCLIGILKAGAAYVPLDSDSPAERLALIVEDCAPTLVLTTLSLLDQAHAFGRPALLFDGFLPSASYNPAVPNISASSLAYVIYTSGSTGKPKGVMVEHGNVTRLFAATQQWFRFTESDVWALFHSIAFDFSVWELWGPLLQGGQLVIVSSLVARSPHSFHRLLCEHRVTVLNQTPSAFKQLSNEVLNCRNRNLQLALRLVIFGGEALDLSNLRPWVERYGIELPRLVNMYGITETTVHVTYRELNAHDIATEHRSVIGEPIPDLEIHILDRCRQPVPIGWVGELYVGGAGVARGYLNRSELTAERFVEHVFSPGQVSTRLYRTGDLGRRRDNGEIEYWGRNDTQVKIRGYRIELGEIEAQLLSHPHVKDVAVVGKEDGCGDTSLVAYVVADVPAMKRLEQESNDSGEIGSGIVQQWKTVFEQTYSEPTTAPSFVGWHSSYTGEPIPESEMREWQQTTVRRIRSLRGLRALEIGCGVGLLIEQLAPKHEVYMGTDLSAVAIQRLREWISKQAQLQHVELQQCSALEFQCRDPATYDIVIINSVVQLFPDLDYLREVLRRAVAWASPTGCIFVGDVRPLPLLSTFHSSVQVQRAGPEMRVGHLRLAIASAVDKEKDLLVDPRFFVDLAENIPGLGRARVELRRGTADNELTRYRYDVVLEKGQRASSVDEEDLDWSTHPDVLSVLESRLRDRRIACIKLYGLPNRRLAGDLAVTRLIETMEEHCTVQELRARLEQIVPHGFDPESFWRLAEKYGCDASVSWSVGRDDGRFDVEIVDPRAAQTNRVQNKAVADISFDSSMSNVDGPLANDPWGRTLQRQLIAKLHQLLKDRLPSYMVPAAIATLDRFPLTSNGKLNVHALPAPDERAYARGQYESATSKTEEALVQIWQELLHVDRVGRHDNFFAMGGHSLLVAQMVERLREEGLATDVRSVFESASLTALAATISKESRINSELFANKANPDGPTDTSNSTPQIGLQPEQLKLIADAVVGGNDNIQDIYPLTPLQEGILFHHLLCEKGDTYVSGTLYEFRGRAELDNFIQALQKMIDRHDALRSAVFWEHLPRPVQVVQRSARLPVDAVLSSGKKPIDSLKEHMAPQYQKLDISRAPLMRLYVTNEDSDSRWYALLQLHHLISDRISVEIMTAEMNAYLKGHGDELPDAAPYRDHVTRILLCAEHIDSMKHFRSRLATIDAPTAPFGLMVVHGDGTYIAEVSEVVDSELLSLLRSNAKGMSLGTATLCHAAWALATALMSGRTDVVFGTVLSGRMQRHATGGAAVGMMINTLPFLVGLRDLTAHELIETVRGELLDLIRHEDCSLANAQQCSAVTPPAPLFTAVINFMQSVRSSDDWSGSGIRVIGHHWRTNFPFALSIQDLPDQMVLTVQTDRRVDPKQVIAYFTTSLRSLLDALKCDPTVPALSLKVLPSDEWYQVTRAFNATDMPFTSGKVVHELFQEQVHQTPDAPALAYESCCLTYSELNGRANQLARYLRTHGVLPDEIVGLCADRGVDLIVGMLGILKSGAAYLPLDPTYPHERLKYMVKDARPAILLVDDSAGDTFADLAVKVLSLKGDWEDVSREVSVDLPLVEVGVTERHLAYVIFTSGSTGAPKGVMLEHVGLCNLSRVLAQAFSAGDGSRVLQFASASFDACTWEWVMALCNGACLCLASREDLMPGEPLMTTLRRLAITHATLPPVALSAMNSADLPLLTVLIAAGEACSSELIRRWAPGRRFINAYGPTEATVCVSMHECDFNEQEPVSIGRPLGNARVYILNSQMLPVPIGVTGEIYIGGQGVARGYLHRQSLTSERFVKDPFDAVPDRRMYKSGDLARWRPDGSIEYLGRNDDQVKVRGFRIETGEIEVQLLRNPLVGEAAVIARKLGTQEHCLVAYITRRGDSTVSTPTVVENLRVNLRDVLPEHMVPSAFVVLEQFPVTPNGKLDRRALASPEVGAYVTREYEPPQGHLEETLARIWRHVLRCERVGRRDNFFDLGGHSLLVLKVVVLANDELSCALKVTDLYRHTSIQELAATIGGGHDAAEFVNLAAEAILNERIRSLAAGRVITTRNVLLTGCMGFVGRFLLSELLKQTPATVYCLVKAASDTVALSRLMVVLSQWDLWRPEFERRIVAISGDLSKPQMGIEDERYRRLCRTIDCVYHCATSMNHLETYAAAKPVNVEATQELLAFASCERTKLINYISTLSVFSPIGHQSDRVITEDSLIDHEKHPTTSGYRASKWVAEKLFMLGRERGITCNIFRAGLVWADARQGRFDDRQFVYQLIKSSVLAGYGIRDYQFELTPTPVDYVAGAIVALGQRHKEVGRTFHIASSEQTVTSFFEACNEILGNRLKLVSHYEWMRQMARLHRQGSKLPVIPLVEYAFSMSEDSFNQSIQSSALTNIRFVCDQTHRKLEEAGIITPAFNQKLLQVCLERLVNRDPDVREGMIDVASSNSERKSASIGVAASSVSTR